MYYYIEHQDDYILENISKTPEECYGFWLLVFFNYMHQLMCDDDWLLK